MSLLAADIGNSHTVLGLLDDGEVVADWRVATDERRTADEWGWCCRGCCATPGTARGRDRRGRRSSVVPAARVARDVRPPGVRVVVEPGVRTGVPVLMDNPREVGSDRIVNALAAGDALRRPDHRGGLRHRHHVRRGQRRGRVRRRRDRPGHRDLPRGPDAAVRSCARSSSSSLSTPSASRPPKRCSQAPCTASPARWRASCTPSGPSSGTSAR